jgi:hypothetical protein
MSDNTNRLPGKTGPNSGKIEPESGKTEPCLGKAELELGKQNWNRVVKSGYKKKQR